MDLSGTYDCKGVDASEGPYSAIVTLSRNARQSDGPYGAYDFRMEVPGFGSYPGEAVSLGQTLAIHFALTNPSQHDFGTGIGTLTIKGGKVSFHKFYYEPAFKGGNHGSEDCVRR